MSQVMTAGRPRGAHRTDTHDGVRIAVSDLRSVRVHRTTRPRPRPTPRPTHARPLPEAQREPGALSGLPPALRAWMDGRPFWAGLCLVVAGIEIGFWPAFWASQRSGVSAIMFMVLLASDGLAVWLLPLYRRLLGVQGAALGVLAVSTANLGGLLLGTCAAILGGAMSFGWQPAAQRPAPRPVERALRAVPPIRDAESLETVDGADAAGSVESAAAAMPVELVRTVDPEREVERTAELELMPELELDPTMELDPTPEPEPTAELEPTPERKPKPKLALVAVASAPAEPDEAVEAAEADGSGAGRHEAPRPRPAANAAEDDLVARAENDEQSFIPGF